MFPSMKINGMFLPILTLLFTVLICVIINYFWQRRRLYHLMSLIPGRKGVFLLGNALDFLGKNNHGKFIKTNKNYFKDENNYFFIFLNG